MTLTDVGCYISYVGFGLQGYYLGNCSLANLWLKADGIECDFGFIVNRVLNDIGSLTQLKTKYGLN